MAVKHNTGPEGTGEFDLTYAWKCQVKKNTHEYRAQHKTGVHSSGVARIPDMGDTGVLFPSQNLQSWLGVEYSSLQIWLRTAWLRSPEAYGH